ncbi:GH25 family lysozyme [Clostridium hydrogenum]|uniref:GH25 family lysozyme n=1 Tax=Clostridium hydrogenum TaxID=2855764 RepID=UPI001F37F850|nr:GH25 family lysozyme [Clostridium hydrogenum]
MPNSQYWMNRIQQIAHSIYNDQERKNVQLVQQYKKLYNDIQGQLDALYRKYSDGDTLSTTEMYRFNRLNNLQSNIKKNIKSLGYDEELFLSKSLYKNFQDVVQQTTQYINKTAGIKIDWSYLDDKFIDSAIKQNWQGGNFSTRTWANKDKLLKSLNSVIVNGIASGQPINNMAAALKNAMGVGAYDALRLARTETMNILNNGQLTSFKNAGYGFVISKITEGSTFVDKYGKQNVASTKSNGLIAGAYHFARFKDKAGAIEEANFFKQNCPANVDFVVLDFEQQCSGDMTDACLAFLDTISSIAPAIIYCNPNYINSYLNSAITKYHLWIANYGVSSPKVPIWGTYAIWQYSESGRVNGISENADLNVTGPAFNSIINRNNSNNFTPNGSIKQLQSLIGANADGIPGPQTLSKCPTIRTGSTGNVVKWLQYVLNSLCHSGLSMDGIFGQGTKQAVINYQGYYKLSMDGIVGQDTWKKILKLS